MSVTKNFLVILLILCYAGWGGGMIAMKYAFTSFSLIHAIFARVIIAGVIYIFIYRKWTPLPYKKGDWKYFILLCMFEPILFFICETSSMQYTTASQGGVIAACFPIVTAIAAWLILGEKLEKKTVLAILLTVVGVAGTAAFADADTATAPNPFLGNCLMFGAVLSSSGYAVCVRFVSRRYSFLSISAIQAIGGTIFFTPLALTQPLPETVHFSAVCALLYLGICLGFLVYLSFNFALQHLEAGVVALLGNLIPIFTLILAYFMLGERLNIIQIICVCITILGVCIATFPTHKKI